MLLLGGGCLRDGRLGLGHRNGRRGRGGLEPAHVATAGEGRTQHEAKRGRRSPQAAAFIPYVPF
ncbi:hypothetical protein BwSH20_46260 [Bradyrhizobium ottawaense]|nr:hypothetical protein SG09_15090 [Bradyrhizobium ottawaense]BBO08707.1 hypothetical protein TM102_01770 [Bradyrhizobium sp. TM102]GMO15194.1 hypothetical protein BwSH14_03760 [Bradyrhizobium ottawaense]GMO18127.1 hypothetical protein BwSF21_10070 [Bradyrhizobium ottawaense]GMO45833.1 hypothetical protein BwSF12_51510 [Bradyrhizobium ottawaense]